VAAVGSVHPSALPAYPQQPAALARLRGFRAGLHGCCTHRADALVDLTDALLSGQGPVASLPQLSLEPAHRRGWGSTYAALARGRIHAERLRDLLVGCLPPADPLVFAVDVTSWRAATPSARRSVACTTTPPATPPANRSWPAGRSSGSRSWASRGTPGPPRWTPACCYRPAAPPRRQVRLRRPGHLAGPDRHPDLSGRPARHRHRAGLGRAASQAAAPPRPRQRRAAPDRARHHPARPGPAPPRPHAAAEGAVAVVGLSRVICARSW
jgi:hypothetical protein